MKIRAFTATRAGLDGRRVLAPEREEEGTGRRRAADEVAETAAWLLGDRASYRQQGARRLGGHRPTDCSEGVDPARAVSSATRESGIHDTALGNRTNA